MCAHSQTNKLQKRPPSAFRNAFSAPRESLNVLRQRGAESRTMAFARHVGVADHGTETDRPRTDGATRWTPSSSSSSPRVSTWGLVEEKIAPAQSEPGPASRDVVPYLSNEHAVPPPRSRLADYSLSFFQQSLAYSSWAVAHPVSAVEHQWAVRATRAEALLDAHTVHRQEVLTLEERRSRELAALNARHAQAYARQQQMVWLLLGAALSALLYFLYRHSPPAPAASSRWHGPLHFTIPILSPFASVIEHETSAVNVPLVAMLLLAAASFAFLWFRCGPRRG